jgi:hypothetical protein
MYNIIIFLLVYLCVGTARGSLYYLTASSLSCNKVTKLGNAQCCCDGCGVTTWGQACNGDLTGDAPGGACSPGQILGPEPDDAGYFGDSTPINTGPICYAPGDCYLQNWQNVFQCCPCPAGYIVYSGSSTPNCDPGAPCVGCTGASEVLSGNYASGYSCTTKMTSIISTPTSTSPADCPTCSPSSESCEFYQCLESEYHCGPTGYPIGYGYKYCEAYADASSQFSSKGQAWISKTRLCLQQALVKDATCKSSCKVVSGDAFASHKSCYVKSGVCGLTCKDYELIFETVGDELFSPQAVLQEIETGASCADMKFFLELIESCISRIYSI